VSAASLDNAADAASVAAACTALARATLASLAWNEHDNDDAVTVCTDSFFYRAVESDSVIAIFGVNPAVLYSSAAACTALARATLASSAWYEHDNDDGVTVTEIPPVSPETPSTTPRLPSGIPHPVVGRASVGVWASCLLSRG